MSLASANGKVQGGLGSTGAVLAGSWVPYWCMDGTRDRSQARGARSAGREKKFLARQAVVGPAFARQLRVVDDGPAPRGHRAGLPSAVEGVDLGDAGGGGWLHLLAYRWKYRAPLYLRESRCSPRSFPHNDSDSISPLALARSGIHPECDLPLEIRAKPGSYL